MLQAFFELIVDFFCSFIEMIVAFLMVPLDIFFSFLTVFLVKIPNKTVTIF